MAALWFVFFGPLGESIAVFFLICFVAYLILSLHQIISMDFVVFDIFCTTATESSTICHREFFIYCFSV